MSQVDSTTQRFRSLNLSHCRGHTVTGTQLLYNSSSVQPIMSRGALIDLTEPKRRRTEGASGCYGQLPTSETCGVCGQWLDTSKFPRKKANPQRACADCICEYSQHIARVARMKRVYDAAKQRGDDEFVVAKGGGIPVNKEELLEMRRAFRKEEERRGPQREEEDRSAKALQEGKAAWSAANTKRDRAATFDRVKWHQEQAGMRWRAWKVNAHYGTCAWRDDEQAAQNAADCKCCAANFIGSLKYKKGPLSDDERTDMKGAQTPCKVCMEVYEEMMS